MYVDTLTWKGHIDHVIKSVSKCFGIPNKIRGLIPNQYKHTVYHACIYSHITYGIEVYGACGVTLQKMLQIVMNKSIKLLFIKSPYHGTNEMFNPKQHCDGNLHNSISGPFGPRIL